MCAEHRGIERGLYALCIPLTPPPPPPRLSPPKHSNFSLERLDNINLHYGETLREWRRRFNDHLPEVLDQGFDDTFIRCGGGRAE